jgi:hypothetical protein
VNQWRKRYATGDVVIVRYADDFVLGFQHRHEAERFLQELRERLEKFGLRLHPDKTRLIEFGRFADENRRRRGKGKPETFDFLGFTHACGRKFKTKGFLVRRLTVKKRLRATLQVVQQALLHCRHEPIPVTGSWLLSVANGYYRYFAVPGNLRALSTFRREVVRAWLHALRRRSQRHRMNWSRFSTIANRWVPTPKILHPHPSERFYAKHPK